MTREPEEHDPLAGASALLRQVASQIDGGEVTAVVLVAVVDGNRLWYRAFQDGFAACDALMQTMDMVDILRRDMRGSDLPLPPPVRAVFPGTDRGGEDGHG